MIKRFLSIFKERKLLFLELFICTLLLSGSIRLVCIDLFYGTEKNIVPSYPIFSLVITSILFIKQRKCTETFLDVTITNKYSLYSLKS